MEQKLKFNCGWAPTQPRAQGGSVGTLKPPGSSDYSLSILIDKFLPLKCVLCGPQTGNNAQFEVSWGRYDEKLLHVCRWCLQDLKLFGFAFNQVLPFRTQRSHQVARLPAVLGACFETAMVTFCHE
jgi:hypothetical protein